MDKWVMFKNYMHNELGITKEDIRAWIKEAVKEQAKLMVKGTFENYSVQDVIKDTVLNTDLFGRNLKSGIKQEAGKILAEELLRQTKENNETK